MADIRCSWPDEQWESWATSEDRTHRKQLQRIVREWSELPHITGKLREIDPNISLALGKLLATYELAHKGALTGGVQIEPSAATHPAVDDGDFDIPIDDCI